MTAGDKHELPPQVWMEEEPIPSGGVLTEAGLDNIANHKYKAGASTHLDNFFSPNLWQPMTDILPMWLAPNLVTTLGGCFCLVSTICSITFLKSGVSLSGDQGDDIATALPQWLFFLNGFCVFTYYTFDCMDGKQARRTNTSSPLGQLFDHGMDCICNLSHLHLVQCITLVPPRLLMIIQCSLQFAFFLAQWEEYFTGILPHAAGSYCGVTEMNYGLALWSFSAGIFGPEIYQVVVIPSEVVSKWENPLIRWFLSTGTLEDELTGAFQVRHAVAVGWVVMVITLILLSWIRVYQHLQDTTMFINAISKLIGPFAICAVALWGSAVCYPEYNPKNGAPACWFSLGLCFCLLTIKIIVYSMANMSYASVQFDVLPFVLVVTALKLAGDSIPIPSSLVLMTLDVFYMARLLFWVQLAIGQLCKRLNINLFRIPHPKSHTE
eukprot:Nitzschia sp. Nitz4//scaffold11_size288233//158887//160197//NITZ4_000778-RA/size288233-processed-gene-0.236-mRNA-1//-1//CDS//3329534086//208//frame0